MNENLKSRSKVKKRALMTLALIFINAMALLSFFIFLYIDERTAGELFSCSFHNRLGIYCPGCGITRAVRSLIRLDVLSSLKYNPSALVLAFTAAYYEVRAIMAAACADKTVLMKSRTYPLIILAVTVLLVFFVRNSLLLFFGIDTTGDFIQKL